MQKEQKEQAGFGLLHINRSKETGRAMNQKRRQFHKLGYLMEVLGNIERVEMLTNPPHLTQCEMILWPLIKKPAAKSFPHVQICDSHFFYLTFARPNGEVQSHGQLFLISAMNGRESNRPKLICETRETCVLNMQWSVRGKPACLRFCCASIVRVYISRVRKVGVSTTQPLACDLALSSTTE